MNTSQTPITTSLGMINGRDAIYLDEFRQEHTTLTATGEVNSTLCSNCEPNKWVKYVLHFTGVAAYKAWDFDLYPLETRMVSSFDVVSDSSWAIELGLAADCHYVLQTYDYIYEILALAFDFQTGEVRPQVSLPRKDLLADMGF